MQYTNVEIKKEKPFCMDTHKTESPCQHTQRTNNTVLRTDQDLLKAVSKSGTEGGNSEGGQEKGEREQEKEEGKMGWSV